VRSTSTPPINRKHMRFGSKSLIASITKTCSAFSFSSSLIFVNNWLASCLSCWNVLITSFSDAGSASVPAVAGALAASVISDIVAPGRVRIGVIETPSFAPICIGGNFQKVKIKTHRKKQIPNRGAHSKVGRRGVITMARPLTSVALFAVCFFLFSGFVESRAQQQPASPPPGCSRERSRHARAVLDEFFHPVVLVNRFSLPPTCPFATEKDMYLTHEQHKQVVRRTQFKSTYIDKVFKSEFHVDKHMDNRHLDKIQPNADVCLAKYCDVLRCDGYRRFKRGDGNSAGGSLVESTIAIHNRHDCDEETLIGVRHKCEDIVRACFPASGGEAFEHDENGENGISSVGIQSGSQAEHKTTEEKATRLRTYFLKHHCAFLTCANVENLFPQMASHRPVDKSGGRKICLAIVCTALVAYYAAAAAR
jgi:hypothetical protein